VVSEVRDDTDRHWLAEAIELSRKCPVSDSAFSVGAVLVIPEAGGPGRVVATGYSRERDPHDHAEETALAKAARAAGSLAAAGLGGATIYSSLEPCLRRLSRPRSCAELIVAAGIRRVVLAWREPPVFVPGGGAEWLAGQGVTVAELAGLAQRARAVNAHLLPD
jgi:pyrimidine deaminase RibD-like protein